MAVPPHVVRFGADRVVADLALLPAARRVGLVTNDAARLAADATRPSRVALRDAGVPIVRLFSPEHGLSATGDDGAPSPDGTDPHTGLPVVSLYGARLAPTPESLADLDLVLFDIPDVGARFYTYLWTLSHVMESCAHNGTPLVVLDRPNPLGGALDCAEGPLLDEICCASFVGRWTMPIRHSLTLGELARQWQRTRLPTLTLHVVACEGWGRHQQWPSLSLPWVSTSPAMVSFDSALLYPGTCLFEGTTLGVGRGTDAPFRRIVAPWLRPEIVAAEVCDPSVRLSCGEVTPRQPPYAGVPCTTLELEVVNTERIRPVAFALTLLATILRTHRAQFAWAAYPTAANPTGADHFARLVGRGDLAALLEALDGALSPAAVARWTDTGAWHTDVRRALLYD